MERRSGEVFVLVFFGGWLILNSILVGCSYRIYDDDVSEPGMLGSTAINRCVALSEFDVSDAHIVNHSASPAAAKAADAVSSSNEQRLPSDQQSVVYTQSLMSAITSV